MADRHQKRLKRCVFIKLSAPHEQLTVTPVKIYLGVWVCGRRWVWERECLCVCVHLRSAVKKTEQFSSNISTSSSWFCSVVVIMYNSFFPPHTVTYMKPARSINTGAIYSWREIQRLSAQWQSQSIGKKSRLAAVIG